MALICGLLFVLIAWLSDSITSLLSAYLLSKGQTHESAFTSLLFKALGILVLSYVHPFGFDWYKPELMFVHSYLGIEKWQFFLILLAMVLTLWRQNLLFLGLILFAYQGHSITVSTLPSSAPIQLVTTHTSVEDKWNTDKHLEQFRAVFSTIDHAIDTGKKMVILPESIFPIFLNRHSPLIAMLKARAKKITIIIGGLYWDSSTPHNSSYIFTANDMIIANKVLLVPFGERNPLPNFLSDWVNKVFYDGAIDYVADSNVTDFTIDGITYRNAICFEATSEALYTPDAQGNRPKNMIVLSNNGWFTPSTEPTLQKLLLEYYSKKYGTTIYHSVNMSESYKIQNSLVTKE